MKMIKNCLIEQCLRRYYALGYCRLHYKRFHKYGDPLFLPRGENGSGHLNKRGYRIFSISDVRKKEHRMIMESHLGRELESHEIVHHKDGNNLNNSLDNLEVMSIGDHSKIHNTKHFGCKIINCEGKHKGFGFCQKHYIRFRKYGDPNTVLVSHWKKRRKVMS
tara:strand:+ start:210 stop:698 length:489 start_codon:yes stop_codon:yes gene_type:complete